VQVQDLVAALYRSPAKWASSSGGPELVAEETRSPEGRAFSFASDQAMHNIRQTESQVVTETLDQAALKRVKDTLGKQADTLLPGLVQGFLDDVPGLLADARRALKQGHAQDLRRAAHTLKSTSATFGVVLLSTVARELEQAARQGELEGADEMIARAQKEFERAREALEEICKGK